MAARQASGIKLINVGMNSNDNNSNEPWYTADILVLAPAFTFAELRTITEVIGKPPNIPLVILPTPWAMSSRFVGVTRLMGSILSTASTPKRVSRLATIAMVPATIQTCLLLMAEKSGMLNKPANSFQPFTTGIATICSALRA
ncbi:hypothetical protein D9M68_676780 [compost metagenome]